MARSRTRLRRLIERQLMSDCSRQRSSTKSVCLKRGASLRCHKNLPADYSKEQSPQSIYLRLRRRFQSRENISLLLRPSHSGHKQSRPLQLASSGQAGLLPATQIKCHTQTLHLSKRGENLRASKTTRDTLHPIRSSSDPSIGRLSSPGLNAVQAAIR